MKRLKFIAFIVSSYLFLVACDNESTNSDDLEFTGQETSYPLVKAAEFDISGTVKFRERVDKSVQIDVELTGTEGSVLYPVHLHYGDLGTHDADIAALLNDLNAEDGKSSTIVSVLSDDSKFTYDRLKTFEGSIKIHQAHFGDGRHVVLAAGNVGASVTSANGRSAITVCKSELN